MKGLFCLTLLTASTSLCSAAGSVRAGPGKDAQDQAHGDNRDLQISNSFRAFKAPFFNNGGITNRNQCTYKPSGTESDLIVEYTGNPAAITEDEIALLESTFLDTFNDVAGNLCDPSFRTISSVQIERADVQIQRQRHLQGNSGNNPTRPRRFSFRLFVLGNCRRCKKDARLFNDAFRRLEEVEGGDQEDRELQPSGAKFKGGFKDHRPIDLPVVSYNFFFKDPFNCDCESASGPVDRRGIKPDEFIGAYNAKIMELNKAGALLSVESSVGVVQVEEVACTTGLDDFTSEVIVDATGDPTEITEDELQVLTSVFLDSYRATSESVCDTEFRVLTDASIEVIEERRDLRADRSSKASAVTAASLNRVDTVSKAGTGGPSVNQQSRFRPVRFRFKVNGRCKGCKSEARLFNDAFRRRLQEEAEVLVDTRLHRDLSYIVNNDTCYCAVDSPKGLPSAGDFSESFDTMVQTEQLAAGSLPNLGSIVIVTQIDDKMPSTVPSSTPTISPTPRPSTSPSATPSETPSAAPSPLPSASPSAAPSPMPSSRPSQMPTITRSASPSNPPPSNRPSEAPTRPTIPTESPIPSPSPSITPTRRPVF
mmetsp:Transcript_20463/g.33914  ORF Transcript_20463/g.33914 Transcript_20463/m.33914 type:complete len:595 (+) Transcript_20463:147-1931(+)|eukprot:CAMPEP_0119016272 /NCGR_PEP_ID=MMETSP1176-20130426/11904_1 /TAXON_ID=265551 /ORGANISM="Synedropsis recta cf, Strain CCMP1620" /LENGTH=594 /DNA_ID=CAMNT_0006969615 /DNA_START=142 /DNA_END=1929 /DNA_ORIENTATION=-